MATSSTFESTVTDTTALVAECAYYKAERRGFVPGFELDDWLEAEREVAAMIARAQPKETPKKKARGKNGTAAKK
jgi:hypothetical protein